jgi:hypothetical protein
LNDILWTKKRLGAFIELACLSEDEIDVLIDWSNHYSAKRTAEERSMSESKVDRLRKRIRVQYDVIQSEYPDLFPVRTKKE